MSINKITREHFVQFVDMLAQSAPAPNDLDLYQKLATKSAIYPGQGTPFGLAYVALKLNGEAGEFAEHVGKAMRDDRLITVTENKEYFLDCVDFENLTSSRHELLIKEIGDILWYLSAACNELNISLSEAAIKNLSKLCGRTERDVLRGSGDER